MDPFAGIVVIIVIALLWWYAVSGVQHRRYVSEFSQLGVIIGLSIAACAVVMIIASSVIYYLQQ